MKPVSCCIKASFVAFALAASWTAFESSMVHAQPALQKVVVAGQNNLGASCVFIADSRGYFKAQGLDIEFQDMGSPENAVLAAVSGSADFGLGGVTAGFFNLAAKDGLKLIAAGTMEKKSYHNVGVLATNRAYASGLKSFKDLAGHRVGLTTLGGPAHYDLSMIAARSGYDISKITVVSLQSVPNLIAAFKGGQIDAMLQSSPIPRQIEGLGIGHIIGWASDLVEAQAGVVFTRPALIANNRSVVAGFVKAYAHGCADYNAAFNQLDAAGKPKKGPGYDQLLQMLAAKVTLPPAQAAGGLAYADPEARLAVADLADEMSYWQKVGRVVPNANIDKLVDASFTKGNP